MPNQQSRYIRPALSGNKILYKGRRYWVFEVNAEHPYEGYEEFGSMVFYDCFYGAAVTEGVISADGVIRGSVPYGQGGYEVEGKTVEEFVSNTVYAMDSIQREIDAAVRNEKKPYYNGRRIQLIRGCSRIPGMYNLGIYDKKYDLEVGGANAVGEGAWEGVVLNGMIDMPVSGSNLQEFIKDIARNVDEAMSE